MSNQPYEGRYEGRYEEYEEYDPYGQPRRRQDQEHGGPGRPQEPQGQGDVAAGHPAVGGADLGGADPASVPAADTAYLPPQGYQSYGGAPGSEGHGEPQGHHGAAGGPPPAEAAARPWDAEPAPAVSQPSVAEEVGVRIRPDGIPLADATPAEVAADATSAYGPATVTGNARITDAQRARAEGRSPIIAPGIQPAALTALLALLLSGAAAVGSWALVVPLVVLQAVTAAGWFRLNGMWPARQGIALAFAGGADGRRRAARGRPGQRARRDLRHPRRVGAAHPRAAAAQPRATRTRGCTA